MHYIDELKTRAESFEKKIPLFFSDEDSTHEFINNAMKYSIMAGGKRIRPLLLLSVYESYKGESEEAMPFAVALEMIHTYSLIHDDLPAMDNDCLRRGKPTNHVVFGEDIAILAGDGLLNLAHELMIAASLKTPYGLKAAQTISQSAGTRGMILGQVADMTFSKKQVKIEDLDYINERKTAALITAALVAGAQLANAPSDDIEILKEMGKKMGLIFQMVDDCLDLYGESSKVGKNLNRDSENKKTTYPMLMGLEMTENRIKTLENELIQLAQQLKKSNTFLMDTITFMVKRDF